MPPVPARPFRSRACAAVLGAVCVTCHVGALPGEHARADEVPVTGDEGASAASTSDGPPAPPIDHVRAIREELAAGRAADARELLAQALAAGSEDAVELAWLEARIETDSGARVAALGRVVDLGGPLALWARIRRATELLSTDPAAALLDATAAASVSFPGREEARDVAAIAGARLGHEGALDVLRERESATARRALADLLAASDEAATREEALGLYRGLDAQRPSSELTDRIEAVLGSLPRARREAQDDAPLEIELARAEALAAQYRHGESRAAFHRVAVRARAAHELVARCRAEMGEGRAHYRERERRDAVELLDAMAERCADAGPDADDARAWGRYFAAKSYANLDERTESVARWDALADELPTHRLADDARVEAARLLLRMDDPARASERLAAAIALGGDMRGEARFLVAWAARAAGDHAAALEALEASLAEGPGERDEDTRGRAAYWRARALADLGRTDEAVTALAELAAREPLSFYGQQARARLFELAPGAVPALLDPRAAPRVSLTPAASLDPAAVARVEALLRVGEPALAARELEALGVRAGGDTSTGWWAASLYAESGAVPRAVELARRSLEESLYADVGDPAWATRVSIAYPLGYRELVEAAAAAESIPASLVFAIAREESSFEPSAVSVAHAYGLLQIMRPTAASIAERLHLPSDTASLARPDVSVRIGARYLGDLARRYDPSPALVPSAYNAGQGAVDRWLRLHRDLPLDAFIEEIPYGETRRYTRRVLMSRGIYDWLREGALPRLPLETPTRS